MNNEQKESCLAGRQDRQWSADEDSLSSLEQQTHELMEDNERLLLLSQKMLQMVICWPVRKCTAEYACCCKRRRTSERRRRSLERLFALFSVRAADKRTIANTTIAGAQRQQQLRMLLALRLSSSGAFFAVKASHSLSQSVRQ